MHWVGPWSAQVKRVGTWYGSEFGGDPAVLFGEVSSFSFMIRPFNFTEDSDPAAFRVARRLGWDCFACTPSPRHPIDPGHWTLVQGLDRC